MARAVGDVVRRLDHGRVAFSAPKGLEVDEASVVHVVVSRNKVTDLAALLEQVGQMHQADIRVSSLMKAHLAGRGFEITPRFSDARKWVPAGENTEWKWDIKAMSGGRQRLQLTLSALIAVDGRSAPFEVKTFERTIDVDVTFRQRIAGLLGGLTWLWAAIVSAVLVPVIVAGRRVWKQRARAQDAEKYGW